MAYDGQQVTLAYQDYRDGQEKTLTLPAGEFLLRLLQHVWPRYQRDVHYYGLYQPARRKAHAGRRGAGQPLRRSGAARAPAVARRAGTVPAGVGRPGSCLVRPVAAPLVVDHVQFPKSQAIRKKPALAVAAAPHRPVASTNVSSAGPKDGSRPRCSRSSMSLTRETRRRQRPFAANAAPAINVPGLVVSRGARHAVGAFSPAVGGLNADQPAPAPPPRTFEALCDSLCENAADATTWLDLALLALRFDGIIEVREEIAAAAARQAVRLVPIPPSLTTRSGGRSGFLVATTKQHPIPRSHPSRARAHRSPSRPRGYPLSERRKGGSAA